MPFGQPGLGPVRFTLSKSGVSISFGVKGARFTAGRYEDSDQAVISIIVTGHRSCG
jgi:hypothetical protein